MIAAGWAKLFWATFPTFHSQELMSLVRLTCPISLIGGHYHFPISVTGALISNVILYGLVGLALEPLRHLSRRAKSAQTRSSDLCLWRDLGLQLPAGKLIRRFPRFMKASCTGSWAA